MALTAAFPARIPWKGTSQGRNAWLLGGKGNCMNVEAFTYLCKLKILEIVGQEWYSSIGSKGSSLSSSSANTGSTDWLNFKERNTSTTRLWKILKYCTYVYCIS